MFQSPSKSPSPSSPHTPRMISMPTITIPFTDHDTLPAPNGTPRSSARRVSYNIKSRAHKHIIPLSIGGIVCFLLLVFTSFGRGPSSFDNASRLRKYSKSVSMFDRSVDERSHRYPSSNQVNGLSVLIADEDELIAEDDLFWETYTESIPMTDEEIAAEAEMAARRQQVIEHDKRHSLRALVYWLVEGGLIPDDWDVPSAAFLKKMGGRGMERLLEAIGSGAEFEEGWVDYAKKAYRVVIFSKTYCPYSKNVKRVFEEYQITPDPLVIELDQRTDFAKIQALLEHLTGRRTVPNVLIDFESFGGSDEVTLLHAEGGLKRQMEEKDLVPRRYRGLGRMPPNLAIAGQL